jgi:NAD(P)H-hydrate epimerase
MFLSRSQCREVDRRAIEEIGMPAAVMMENAGRGTAALMLALGIHGRVVICCGKGNNGGDGFVIARHLDNAGVPTRVLLFAEPADLTGPAAIHYGILAKMSHPVSVLAEKNIDGSALEMVLARAEWIVDALFGTGLAGPVRSPFGEIIRAMNAAPCRRLAVDIPSGLDCDTGLPLGPTVHADHTATFIALKKGFQNPDAQPWLGQAHVIDIGIPTSLIPT